ncbi:hypothetical protein K505DRAFT_285723 [Melanomma pulvis-pyrius CBS 109.77]|uniref:Acyltransferase 3 domain-containing protein n=1 Tax=Melanomma pulvis-pyrius CBS 109.77 TaxID=1314802 RepID=A0A6A6WWR2_9PLEO|nr:hypothetical protein K505DRAFT_285723 [Melanomma pulvis-pyrius CBS 109.77]
MAFPSRASVDAAPLLESEFEEKLPEGPQSRTGKILDILSHKFSVRPILATLRPSFLQRASSALPQKPQHPTAWLDGLRGFAAFFVFIYHFQHMFHKAYNFGYGSNEGNNDHWLIQLPIIRLIFTGGPMVSIFWVLSGVSLSLKPIQLARSQSWDKFFDVLFSSVFRRMLRLYLPVFIVQFGVLIATLLGFFNHAWDLSSAEEWPFGGTNEKMHEVKDTNLEQIQDWIQTMWKFANPFRPSRPKYDIHLWTIPLEFRNSIILFATLVGFSKLRPRIRIVLTWVLWAYCMLVNEGDVALFIAGMGIAEYMLIQDEVAKQLPSAEATPSAPHKQSTLIRSAWAVLCFIGLHLLSWPAWKYETSLGYTTMYNLTPRIFDSAEMTWSRVGAAVFVIALCGSEVLRRPFQTPLAIYLGKISFPLYIIHGPINHILGIWFVELYWVITGSTSFAGYEAGVILAFCTEAVVVVWLADLLMRTVDAPSVRFGRTLQNRWSV